MAPIFKITWHTFTLFPENLGYEGLKWKKAKRANFIAGTFLQLSIDIIWTIFTFKLHPAARIHL